MAWVILLEAMFSSSVCSSIMLAALRSKPHCHTSFYFRSSHTYSKSRSGSSCPGSYCGSCDCSHSHSSLPSPQHPRSSRRQSRDYVSRTRSHGHHSSRSRSPPPRRHHWWSRTCPSPLPHPCFLFHSLKGLGVRFTAPLSACSHLYSRKWVGG